MSTLSPPRLGAFGRYTLVRRIGVGGMGEVYLAREGPVGSGRACVIKKVLPGLSENRQFLGRFLDEAKVSVQLRHPNVARVYAMGEVGGEYFLAMEYVQGKTVSRLSHRLREKGTPWPLGLILLLGERICAGLSYAHGATGPSGELLHLVHRDMSPSNVCVSYRGEIKIIDFGAAQSTLKEQETAPRVVIGNLTYMSPEQARKLRVDKRADIYSTAATLWELCANDPLPQKGDPVERWRRAADPKWESLTTVRPDLPPEVDAVLRKALSRNPDHRHADASELGLELLKLRARFGGNSSEEELGRLLEGAFPREKAIEDALLAEINQGEAIQDIPTDKQRAVIPATALAFEHRAFQAPAADFAAAQVVTAPGLPEYPRLPAPTLGLDERRFTFGVEVERATDVIRGALFDEIEGPDDGGTRPFDAFGFNRLWPIFAGVFGVALAAGFGVVWLLS